MRVKRFMNIVVRPFCPVCRGTQERVAAAPKARSCISGGDQHGGAGTRRARLREAEAPQTAVAREFSLKQCPIHAGENGRPSMCCLTCLRFEGLSQSSTATS
jgi:hypothetical protein